MLGLESSNWRQTPGKSPSSVTASCCWNRLSDTLCLGFPLFDACGDSICVLGCSEA